MPSPVACLTKAQTSPESSPGLPQTAQVLALNTLRAGNTLHAEEAQTSGLEPVPTLLPESLPGVRPSATLLVLHAHYY